MKFVIKRKVDELGRIVLPKDFRDYYNIGTGDEVRIVPIDSGILVTKESNDDTKSEET